MNDVCKIVKNNTITASRNLGLGVIKVLYGTINGDWVDYEVDILDAPYIEGSIYPVYSSCKLKDIDKVVERELIVREHR